MYEIAVVKKNLLTRSCRRKFIKNLLSKKQRKHVNQATAIYIKNYIKNYFFLFFEYLQNWSPAKDYMCEIFRNWPLA